MKAISLAAAILAATNAARAKVDAPALTADARLAEAARLHSEAMLATGELSHEEKDPKRRTPADRAEAAGFRWRKVGENVAHYHGWVPSADEAVKDWLGSPPHKRNLVDAGFTKLGVGVACRKKDCWLTQLFGAD